MKKKSKFFLIYSIALFSVALILILFSAFTGIRYKTENNATKVLYDGARTNVITLTNENEELTRQNEEKQRQIDELSKQTAELEEKLSASEQNAAYVSENIEKLLQTNELLNAKKSREARSVFDTIDTSALGDHAKVFYEQIRRRF